MNREIPLEVLDKMYIKLTKEFKVDETPKIKIKLPISKSKLLTKVFDNIFKYIEETNDFKLTEISIGAFMEMAVPNFDDNQFKSYHAELIKTWYLEIVKLLKAVTINKENEITTELNNGE